MEEMIMEPTRFCRKMQDRLVKAALDNGWIVREDPSGAPSFQAHKDRCALKVTLGRNGNLTEVKFAGEDIPLVAAAGLVPMLFGMQGD
jgi:hypothetical protein